MTYKVLVLMLPFVISSISSFPSGTHFDKAKVVSAPLTFKPLDPDIPTLIDYFTCTTFGPFSLSSVTNNESVTFTYELRNISSQNIVERIRLFNSSNSVVFSSSKAYIYYQKGQRNSVSFTVPVRDHLTRNGLTLKFEIVSVYNSAILKTYSASFYPSSDATISWLSLKQEIYTSKSLGFYSDNNQIHELIETIDFTRFGDYLDIDYYYRLNLNRNIIYYPNSKCAFRYKNAYLVFNDADQLFPYLNHQNTDDIKIPLSMLRTGETVIFRYKNSFYINKRTLQISDTYQNGFVTTNDFYLPVNGKSKFNGKQLYFSLEGFGLDNISSTIPLKYQTSKSLVGICKDGDYCIIGGKR